MQALLVLAFFSASALAAPADCDKLQSQLDQVRRDIKDLQKMAAPGHYPENQLYYRALVSLQNQERKLVGDLGRCR